MEAKNGMKDRCAGVLIGLAAGDRNGGPIRLSLRLLDSLLEKNAFDDKHVANKYLNYYQGPPYDSEKAFDTGNTFYQVFKLFSEGHSIQEASKRVQDKYGSIGVGAAHRNAVISMAIFLDNEDLHSAVFTETYMTHANHISYEVSLFVNVICRELIIGTNWKDSIQNALNLINEPEVRDAIDSASKCQESTLDRDGYAPKVLQAALYFIHNYNSFQDSLNESIRFAGNNNYCPVLVGSIGGARYGAKEILILNQSGEQSVMLNHCLKELFDRVLAGAENMGNLWLKR